MRTGFSYSDFVKGIIDNEQAPILPAGLVRQAIVQGAPHEGDKLRMRLREACDSLANSADYRRIRIKGVSGYHYLKIEAEIR